MKDLTEIHEFLTREARGWIARERERHRPSSEVIPPKDRRTLAPFFPDSKLELARVRHLAQIENPAFFDDLGWTEGTMPFDFRDSSGITFVDTIVISDTRPVATGDRLALLFHEMVHIVQYAVLGLNRFVEEYVQGWTDNNFEYYSIPLEKMAFDLEARYRADPDRPFSVEIEVARALDR